MIPQRKVCSKCKEEKDLTEFGKNKSNKDGHQYYCNDCRRAYRENNKDKIKEQRKREYERNKDRYLIQAKAWYENNKDRVRENKRRYRQENKDKIREAQRLYRKRPEVVEREKKRWALRWEKDKDKIKEKGRLWYENNKEEQRRKGRLYQKNNPAKFREAHHRRRARKLENGYEYFTHEQLIEHWIANEIDPEKCFYCKEADFQQVDHYIPIAKGGPHYKENLRPACARCNRRKSDKLPEVWLEETNSL